MGSLVQKGLRVGQMETTKGNCKGKVKDQREIMREGWSGSQWMNISGRRRAQQG